jgi:hypothetical protein
MLWNLFYAEIICSLNFDDQSLRIAEIASYIPHHSAPLTIKLIEWEGGE